MMKTVVRQLIRSSKSIQSCTKANPKPYSSLCALSMAPSKSHLHTMRCQRPCSCCRVHATHAPIFSIGKRYFAEALEPLEADAILKRIEKVLSEMERCKLDASKPLTGETHIYNDCGLDSLDFVEFGIALEDEFGIEIDDDKAEHIITIGDAVKLIQETPVIQTAQ